MTIAPEITTKDKLYYLGCELDYELDDAIKGEIIKDSHATKSFLEFLVDCQNKEKRAELFTRFRIFGHNVYSHSASFDSGFFSKIVSEYAIGNKKNFHNLIENCRRTAKNVLKYPKVRSNWKDDFMKESVREYKNFINHLQDPKLEFQSYDNLAGDLRVGLNEF